MKKNDIAIIGFGSIAKKHYAILKNHRKIKNIYIISKSLKKINKPNTFILKNKDELKTTNIDKVFICSPSSQHLNDAVFFMKKNCEIFIEKPFTNKLQISKKTLSLFSRYKKKILIGYPFRFSSAALNLKNIIQKKELGKIIDVEIACGSYLPSWRKNKPYQKSVSSIKKLGGGVIFELSHEIDYLLWLFGAPKKVISYFNPRNLLNIETEEFVRSLFIYKNFSINVKLSFNQEHLNERYCKIVATKSILIWNLINKTISVYKNNILKEKKIFIKKDKDLLKKEISYFLNNKIKNIKNKKIIYEQIRIIRLINKMKKKKISYS